MAALAVKLTLRSAPSIIHSLKNNINKTNLYLWLKYNVTRRVESKTQTGFLWTLYHLAIVENILSLWRAFCTNWYVHFELWKSMTPSDFKWILNILCCVLNGIHQVCVNFYLYIFYPFPPTLSEISANSLDRMYFYRAERIFFFDFRQWMNYLGT